MKTNVVSIEKIRRKKLGVLCALEAFDDVKAFVDENQDDVIFEIGNKINYSRSSVEWGMFCPAGFEMVDLDDDEEHLYIVYAEGEYDECSMQRLLDGDECPCENPEKCHFYFYIDLDEDGNYIFNYPCDENGEIDERAITFYVSDDYYEDRY